MRKIMDGGRGMNITIFIVIAIVGIIVLFVLIGLVILWTAKSLKGLAKKDVITMINEVGQ